MVEQRSPKPTVEGSSPSAPAIRPLIGVFLFWAISKRTRHGNGYDNSILSALDDHIICTAPLRS